MMKWTMWRMWSPWSATFLLHTGVHLWTPATALAQDANASADEMYEKETANFAIERAKMFRTRGDIPAACNELDKALKTYSTIKTLFSLADCRDREGKMAAALLHYRVYLEQSNTIADDEREKEASRIAKATERVAALEVDVPKLKVVWHGQIPTDAKILVDGRTVSPNETQPMEPGRYLVYVEQNDAILRSHFVNLERAGGTLEVDMSPPVPAPKPLPGKPKAPTKSPNMVVPLFWGAGGASILSGGILGIAVRSSDADDKQHEQLRSNAGTMALVQLGVGAIFVVSAVVLSSSPPEKAPAVRVSVLGNQGVVVGVEGSF